MDLKFLRLQCVKQILRAMDCQYEMDANFGIWIDGHLWNIYLPEDDINQVLLRFDQKVETDQAADLALRFDGVARLLGLEVYMAGTIYPDSTSPVASWITVINEK